MHKWSLWKKKRWWCVYVCIYTHIKKYIYTLINGRSSKNVKFGEKSGSNLRLKRDFVKVESKYDLEP